MRMLMNNLDSDIAEKPEELVVYGGTGKAARNWECFDAIVQSLQSLENDETLLIQSGKPVGIFRTHEDVPRVLLANSNLVPAWATWEEFWRLEGLGLIMYGQMAAGSWIYIGTQGILQGTYESFPPLQPTLRRNIEGAFVLTAGLGGMGGAQPLAATMNGAAVLCVEVDGHRIQRRIQTRYCDQATTNLDEALKWINEARKEGRPLSVALQANAADIYPELVRRNVIPDVVTDQTSAHDPLNGYIPNGLPDEDPQELRQKNPKEYIRRSMEAMATHVHAMLEMQKRGAIVFDYGNNLRGQALQAGETHAFDFPGFVVAYVRPLFCEGKGPFRWVALSGDPADINRTDKAILEMFPKNEGLARWIRMAHDQVQFQGLPARICWLGYGERAEFGEYLNQLVKKGEVKAPIVIGRDHLDCGSVASPRRETEGMKDGSDAIADWPILNALLNAVSGATWVSFHHGGGVGIGQSLHAGMVIVADGTDAASKRLKRVLTCDPGMASFVMSTQVTTSQRTLRGKRASKSQCSKFENFHFKFHNSQTTQTTPNGN